MRILAIGLILILAQPACPARDEYQVHQENRNYEAWREKAFFGSSSNSSSRSSSTVPLYTPPTQPPADYARQSNRRYLEQMQKEEDAYNARVAQQNARNDALNQRYATRRRLNEQALQGNIPAMRMLADDVLSDSAATEADKQAAAGWMAEAASRGDAVAAQHVALIAEARRRQQAEAVNRANAELLARADAGDVRAIYTVGWQPYLSTDPKLHLEGVRRLRKAVEKNDPETLEFLYHRASRSEMGEEETALILQVTERLGNLPNHPDVALMAAEIHLLGHYGVKADRNAALPFLLKAVDAGYPDAIIRMGEIYDQAIGGPRDVAAAIEWYRKALPYEHPEFGLTKDQNVFKLSRVLLEPGNNPKEHAQELLRLWDENMLSPSSRTRKLALLAADALASGAIGVDDPDREIFYLSRVANDDWSHEEPAEQVRVSTRFGSYVMAHAEPGPRIVAKEGKEFVIRPAKKADAIWAYCFGIFNAPDTTVDACLAAAYTALSLPDEDLKAAGQLKCAYVMFDATADKFDDARAWYESGRLLLLAKGMDRDPAAANERLLKAWAKGSAKAALMLAIIQQKKWIPNATDEAAEEWIKRGALKDDPDCMRHYGLQLLATKSDDPAKVADQKKAGVEWLQKSAKAGNADALDDLADAYEKGEGVAVDAAKTVELLTQASAGGSGSAKRKLATRLAEGRGVPKDQKAALKLMFEAAQTDQLAAGNLGVVLWRGDWGEKSVEDGLNWMEVALERGFWAAGRNLAKIYHLGLGVPADEAKAHTYLERAGTIGGLPAATAVAEFYAAGEVIAKDDEAAARWRSTASQLQASAKL